MMPAAAMMLLEMSLWAAVIASLLAEEGGNAAVEGKWCLYEMGFSDTVNTMKCAAMVGVKWAALSACRALKTYMEDFTSLVVFFPAVQTEAAPFLSSGSLIPKSPASQRQNLSSLMLCWWPNTQLESRLQRHSGGTAAFFVQDSSEQRTEDLSPEGHDSDRRYLFGLNFSRSKSSQLPVLKK